MLSVCKGLFARHLQCDARLDRYNCTAATEWMKVSKIHFIQYMIHCMQLNFKVSDSARGKLSW